MITIIPFKILEIDGEGYHLVIQMQINNKPANVIIDTGASKTVFDKARIAGYVADTNFGTHAKLSTGLGTNRMKSHVTTLEKIQIGGLEINNYSAILLDLSHVNESYRQVGFPPVEGVLGSDIMVEYKAGIDYEKRELRLKFKKTTNRKYLKEDASKPIIPVVEKPDLI